MKRIIEFLTTIGCAWPHTGDGRIDSIPIGGEEENIILEYEHEKGKDHMKEAFEKLDEHMKENYPNKDYAFWYWWWRK